MIFKIATLWSTHKVGMVSTQEHAERLENGFPNSPWDACHVLALLCTSTLPDQTGKHLSNKYGRLHTSTLMPPSPCTAVEGKASLTLNSVTQLICQRGLLQQL